MTEDLVPRTIFAMPVGPPYGGMTTYTAMLRSSRVFQSDRAALFDTSPPSGKGQLLIRLLHSMKRTFALLVLVRRHRAEVVYFMSSDYLGFFEKGVMSLLCQILGAKSVLHLVGSFVDFYGSAAWRRPLIRFLLRRVSAVITVHSRMQAYVSALSPSVPVWVIPNPVACDEFGTTFAPRAVQDQVHILFAGSLTQAKGILDLIEVARIFKTRLAGARIVVIGDGELAEECERQIHRHDLEQLVELKGYVDEPAKRRLLASSHIFCLPSHSEGTPISVLEAMASGLPVVATTVGGIPSVVDQGVQGWLVAPGDHEGLGRALVSLAGSEAVRRAMGRSGFERVRRLFDIKIVADRMISHLNVLARLPSNSAVALQSVADTRAG